MDKIIKIKENYSIKESTFTIELEYYYDGKNDEYYSDYDLTNKNLKRIRDKYREINNLSPNDKI